MQIASDDWAVLLVCAVEKPSPAAEGHFVIALEGDHPLDAAPRFGNQSRFAFAFLGKGEGLAVYGLAPCGT